MKYMIFGLVTLVVMAFISSQLFIHMYSILQEL
jgi:hypothetical protein